MHSGFRDSRRFVACKKGLCKLIGIRFVIPNDTIHQPLCQIVKNETKMSERKPIKTTVNEIVEYWESRIDESELSIDFAEAHERCWRCGYKSKLHRCHIIPDSLEGEDSPSNLVLLCQRCHIEAPNINDKDFFWEWLKAQKAFLYDTYWTIRGMKEYSDIYKEKIEESMTRLDIGPTEFREFLREQTGFVTIHFGEGRLNLSTIAGIMRSFIKQKEKQLGITNAISNAGLRVC